MMAQELKAGRMDLLIAKLMDSQQYARRGEGSLAVP